MTSSKQRNRDDAACFLYSVWMLLMRHLLHYFSSSWRPLYLFTLACSSLRPLSQLDSQVLHECNQVRQSKGRDKTSAACPQIPPLSHTWHKEYCTCHKSEADITYKHKRRHAPSCVDRSIRGRVRRWNFREDVWLQHVYKLCSAPLVSFLLTRQRFTLGV